MAPWSTGLVRRARPAGNTCSGRANFREVFVLPTFDQLGLPQPLLTALSEAGITEPFEIQAATPPDAVPGGAGPGRARAGAARALGSGLARLARLDGGRAKPKRPRALILVPTRE